MNCLKKFLSAKPVKKFPFGHFDFPITLVPAKKTIVIATVENTSLTLKFSTHSLVIGKRPVGCTEPCCSLKMDRTMCTKIPLRRVI